MNYRNLFLTMALGGLWHGAAAHFFFWGVFHGLALIVHKEFQNLQNAFAPLKQLVQSKLGNVLSVIVTFHSVCIGWVLFRAETNEACASILQKMFFLQPASQASMLAMKLPEINYPLIYPSVFVLLPILVASHFIMGYVNQKKLLDGTPKGLKAVYCFALMVIILAFSPDKSPRFIYFQF